VYNGLLYAGNGTDGVVDRYNGAAWTAGIFNATNSVRSMAVYEVTVPRLFVGTTLAAGSEIKAWSGAALSAALYVLQEPDCLAMAVYGGYLWLFGSDATNRRGGIYRYDGTSWDRRNDIPENYVTSAIVHNGLIYLGMGASGELWSFDGSGSPKVVASGLTASGDTLRGLAVWQRALWVSTRSGTEIHLRRLDPDTGAWAEPVAGGAINASDRGAGGLATLSGVLYAAGRKSGTAAPVYAVTAGVYPTAAKTLETLLFSANLGSDDKIFRTAIVNHAAITSGDSVELQYRLEDAGAWTSLGTSSTVGATSKSLSFPAATVGKLIALRVILTATASATPQIYSVQVRYALQPATKRQWLFEALFEGTVELPLITLDQTPDPKTGAQISSAIWAQKAANGPITLVDLDGTSYSVWFLDLEEKAADRSQRRGYSTRGKCRLIEA